MTPPMRRHFISKPCGASRWGYVHGQPHWTLHVVPDWQRDLARPSMYEVAACTSEESVLAARRLLCTEMP